MPSIGGVLCQRLPLPPKLGRELALLLFIDEDIPPRIAAQLNERGKQATHVQTEMWKGTKDPPLIAAILAKYGTDVVLVTGDDNMPAEHAADVAKLTVAVVDPRFPDPYTLDQWRRDVVHRWAHVMERQPLRSVRRYGQTVRPWRLRTRRRRS